MRKIIFLLFIAAVFIGCKTESSPDPVKGPWKVTIDTKTAPGLSNYNLTVEDGKPLSSQLTQTPTNPFDFITSNTTYNTGDAYITGYRDLDGQLYDLASTPVTKDITIRVEWGFKNINEATCATKTVTNPADGYINALGVDFAGVYCNTKEFDSLNKLHDGGVFIIAAALRGKVDLIQYFLLRGANINMQNAANDNALIKAADNLQYNAVKYLGDNKADLNIQGVNRNTALMLASLYDDEEDAYNIVKYLVDKGANVNLQNDTGFTALINAVGTGYSLRIVQYLVQNGKADLSIKNNAGKTALVLATEIKDNASRPQAGAIYTYLSTLPTTP